MYSLGSYFQIILVLFQRNPEMLTLGLPPATSAMVESLGVGWAIRILGVLAFTVNVICAMLMKDRNKAIGSSQLAFDYRLFKKVEFWLILGWGFFSMLGYIVLLFSLPNYATSVSPLPN